LPARNELTGEDTSFWSVKYIKIKPCIGGAFYLEFQLRIVSKAHNGQSRQSCI
jgi:hypothetical protein